jgi:hypothetical protein
MNLLVLLIYGLFKDGVSYSNDVNDRMITD